MSLLKDEIIEMIQNLPENTSLEDVQYHLYVLEKIKKGIERGDNEGTLSQEDVEKRLKPWIIE